MFAGVLVVLPTTGPSDPQIPVPVVSRVTLANGAKVDGGWSTTVKGDTNLVGLQWEGDRTAEFAIDRRTDAGQWRSIGTTGQTDVLPDRGSPDARSATTHNGTAAHASEPVWVGDAKEVRVRLISGSARRVKFDRVRAPRPSTPAASAGASVPDQPGIVSRAGWGADESLRLARCPSGPDYDARVQLAIVHHTDNSNDYSQDQAAQLVRSIYAYHTVSLGYCDIAYDFLIDRFGTVYEGRYGGIAKPVHGAHSIGYNTNTTGIALIGNYSTGAPAAPQLSSLISLIGWKLAIHNVNAGASTVYTTIGNDVFPPGTTRVLPTVIGHRDTWSTDCPGQNLYALLPAIGAAAAALQAAAPPSSWRSWDALAGSLVSAPASASWQPGRLDSFVQGTNNELWHKWFDNGWHEWESLGGTLSSAPVVSSWTEGRLDVFSRDPSGQVVHRFFDGSWSNWEQLGGSTTGAPAAVSWVMGRIDLFVRGADNQLGHRFYSSGWSAWEELGGTLTEAPTASSWAEGRLDVFVRGSDNQMWHSSYESGWSGWDALDGVLGSGPSAVSWQPQRIDVFARGSDNQMWHRWFG